MQVPRRVLDPISRVSEILFGVIMALTFTCSLSALNGGREEVRTMLLGAIGCNVAWGLIDGMMFIMNALIERGRDALTLRALREASSPEQARAIVREALPFFVASALTGDDVDRVRGRMLGRGDAVFTPRLTKDDWLGAIAVFLLVFLSTFPVAIPFVVFRNVEFATRISNLVAIALLFAAGYVLARHGGFRPWRTGVTMVAIGTVLVAITIALGG